MRKCAMCGLKRECAWTWQPFGPGDDPNCFVAPGSHYRGFPALPCCETCKMHYQFGGVAHFTYKGKRFKVDLESVKEPDDWSEDMT
jgi:hypothetical protein